MKRPWKEHRVQSLPPTRWFCPQGTARSSARSRRLRSVSESRALGGRCITFLNSGDRGEGRGFRS